MQEPTKRPECRGTKFERGKNVIMYVHLKCLGCGRILWEAHDSHFDTHGYCGSPIEHWEQATAEVKR